MEQIARSYYQLMKPGITLSNTIATTAGTLLATSVFGLDWRASLAVIAAVFLIVGSAGALNNVIDRRIDTRMQRTKRREVVRGVISARNACLFAALLAGVGFLLLSLYTNIVTVFAGVAAYGSYIAVYGYAKRHTIFSTIIGTFPGALPPLAGYTAVAGSLDAIAATLFLMMTLWQLPHFYAISIFRQSDYANAGVPIWSVVRGIKEVKYQIIGFSILFLCMAPILTILGATGWTYLVGMAGLALWWVTVGLQGLRVSNDITWAKRMFGVSLSVLLGMCLLQAIGGFLP